MFIDYIVQIQLQLNEMKNLTRSIFLKKVQTGNTGTHSLTVKLLSQQVSYYDSLIEST